MKTTKQELKRYAAKVRPAGKKKIRNAFRTVADVDKSIHKAKQELYRIAPKATYLEMEAAQRRLSALLAERKEAIQRYGNETPVHA